VDPRRFLHLAAETPPVVVLGEFDSPNTIGVARDLGRRGVPVLMLDCNRHGLSAPSRFAAKWLCPDPHYDEPGFLDELMRVGAALPRKAVVFPVRDDYVVPLARAASRLSEHYVLPFCTGEAMALLNDKWQQLEAARRAGVDAPPTALLLSADDVRTAGDSIRYPAVLKPAVPQAGPRQMGVKAVPVSTRGDLPGAYEQAKACGPLLLQEFVPGGEDQVYYLGSYLDKDSRPLAVFTGRRLRQHPPMYGLATLAESVWAPEVAQAGLDLLREMGYHGVSHVEFKRDPRDGGFRLMEINTRHYGTHGLATACGVNLSLAAYDDALGRPHTAPRQREGGRWLHARRYLAGAGRGIRARDVSLRELVTPLCGVRVDGVLSLDDPLPGAVELFAKGAGLSKRLAAAPR
jgi:predicted ATP-grasp superfamily ATP-dependent carboligase